MEEDGCHIQQHSIEHMSWNFPSNLLCDHKAPKQFTETNEGRDQCHFTIKQSWRVPRVLIFVNTISCIQLHKHPERWLQRVLCRLTLWHTCIKRSSLFRHLSLYRSFPPLLPLVLIAHVSLEQEDRWCPADPRDNVIQCTVTMGNMRNWWILNVLGQKKKEKVIKI